MCVDFFVDGCGGPLIVNRELEKGEGIVGFEIRESANEHRGALDKMRHHTGRMCLVPQH